MEVRKGEHDTNFYSKHFKEEEGHGSGGFFANCYKVFRKYLGIFNEKSLCFKKYGKDLGNWTFPSIILSATCVSYLCTDDSVLLQSISLSKQCFQSFNKKLRDP